MTIEEIKRMHQKGGYSIFYRKVDEKYPKWSITDNFIGIDDGNWKIVLINDKHKHVALSVVDNSDIEIERRAGVWEFSKLEDEFFSSYKDRFDYRVKPKSDSIIEETTDCAKVERSVSEIKRLFDAGGHDCYFTNSGENYYRKLENPMFTSEFNDSCKLIDKKHSHIAEAVSKDPNTIVETMDRPFGCPWEAIDGNFFETYNSKFPYRLQPKKEIATSDEKCEEETNSFKKHGFEVPSWNGDILFKADGKWLYGWIEDDSLNLNYRFMASWDSVSGACVCVDGTKDFSYYNLTQIPTTIEVEKVVAYELNGNGVVESREIVTIEKSYWDKLSK